MIHMEDSILHHMAGNIRPDITVRFPAGRQLLLLKRVLQRRMGVFLHNMAFFYYTFSYLPLLLPILLHMQK